MPGSNGPSGAGGAAPTPPSQPPPSVSPWQAPQPSYDPHSNRRGRGDKLPDAQTLGRYFRRATRPDLPEGPIPAVWQRGAHLMAGVTSAVVGVFMVFYMDFGNRDHCFMPLRKWAGTEDYDISLWPRTKEEDWIKKTGFTREELVRMVGEEELEKAAPDNSTRRKKITYDDVQATTPKLVGNSGNAPTPTSPSTSPTSSSAPSIAEQVKGTIWTRRRTE